MWRSSSWSLLDVTTASLLENLPGLGRYRRALLAMAPFAAINETQRRKFLVADAEVILFSGRVSREILSTLMSTRLVTERKTATSVSGRRDRLIFLVSRQAAPTKESPATCTRLLAWISTRGSGGRPEARRICVPWCQEMTPRMFLPTRLSPILSTA